MNKIILGPILEKDYDILFNWINNRDLILSNNNYSPIHENNHKNWFYQIISNPNVRIFSIRKVDSNEIIGTCQLNSLDWLNRSGEIQIRIGNSLERGKGYGYDAVSQLLSFGFRDLGLERIYVQVFESNERAIKLYKRIGFSFEGTLRNASFIDGKFMNVVLMSIIKSEFIHG